MRSADGIASAAAQRGSLDFWAYMDRGRSDVGAMKKLGIVFILAYGVAFSLAANAQQAPRDGPRYANGTNLVRPTDYREWTFLSSGLGMTYEPPVGSPPAGSPSGPGFGNVFVNPSSYRSFMQTGKWPDGTIFILEGRNSASEASINKAGRFQTDLAGIEAEVKDSRFPDGWAFFNFGPARSMKDVAEPLAGQVLASCVECHTKNTAVERTFVQFYPTLLEVARRKGTLKPGF
jgi:hypothetical protein